MPDTQLRSWAYGLTVAGGALILAGAAMMLFFWGIAGTGDVSGTWWMPGGHMGGFRTGVPWGGFVLWGAVTGALVLFAGIRMRPGGPGEGSLEGILAIVASALSFPAMGGFMFGALLGVTGGALSLAANARRAAREDA